MKRDVETLYRSDFFSIAEHQFALMLARISGETSPLVLLGAALALNRSTQGDVCVDISAAAGRPILSPEPKESADLK